MDKKTMLNNIINHYSGGNKASFSRMLGVTAQAISTWMSRGTFDVGLIYSKCEYINPEWLLTGNGEMLKTKESHPAVNFSISEHKQKGYAPYYSDLLVSAGRYDLSVLGEEVPESWIKFPGIKAEAWFPIIGCSMEPKVFAGDTIGVVEMNNWEKLDPDKIYLIITRDDRMIKHLESDENNPGILWAISENYKRFKIITDDILRIFHVVFAGRLI